MQAAIRFENVTKKYGRTMALDEVSFEVPKGAVFALLGENGAGKTTAIRSMLGFESLNSGKINVLGLDSNKDFNQIRHQVGYVSDSPMLMPWMTVKETGWFVGGFYPAGYQSEFEKLCASYELDLNKKVKNLSKGMKAKLALSLAMANQPELLVLDEPTSGLDTLVRRSFLESMIELTASGSSVFVSSHQISELERVADYIAIMHGGKLLVSEPLDSLKSRLERWTITLDQDFAIPTLKANLLSVEKHGRSIQLVLSNPGSELLCRLREVEHVAAVQVEVPTLEDIFVTLIRERESSTVFSDEFVFDSQEHLV